MLISMIPISLLISFCECPMTSQAALYSRRWTGPIGLIGQHAARTIDRIIRPRGCKSGARHRRYQPIHTRVTFNRPIFSRFLELCHALTI